MGLLAMVFGENYRYYDTPEGQDCFDKLFYVTKYATAYGIVWASVDVTLFSHPVGYAATLARLGAVTLPVVGTAAAWTAAVCASANIRKKDDHVNYAIGGLAAGSFFGACRKSVKVGCYSALALAALSALKWDLDDQNYITIGKKPKWNNIWSVDRDYSITRDPPKTWTT